jgi:hypothetical protein
MSSTASTPAPRPAAAVAGQPIKLAAGDAVRLATWRLFPYDRCTAIVQTARADAAKYGENAETAHEQAKARGHQTAWATYTGGAILGDKAARIAQEARELANFERAITVEHGQLVEIEGEVFAVHVPFGNHQFPRNSDPIQFLRNALV